MSYEQQSSKIEQSRFSYVLKTIESNLENLCEKIQLCDPSQTKSSYAYLKFNQTKSYGKTLEGSMLDKSSILSSPTMFSEEIAIEAIFKLLSRADKILVNLADTK